MVKRFFDIAISVVALIILSPIMLVTAALIARKLGRPVLFRQQRPGRFGRPFTILKFRSMTDQRDAGGNLLPDSVRLTSFGKFVRAASLDELPSLLNVLMGDMSLVGPRPLLMEYLPLYTSEQARRHEARPGLTGWAQVNGRNSLCWEEKFRLDVWYVDNQTFWLDFKIILTTVVKVLKRSNISAEGDVTMPKFTGISES